VQGHVLFHVIQTSFFVNQSWAQHQGSGWLNELQTHGWESTTGKILYLYTWSKGHFSDEEMTTLEMLFRFYFSALTRDIQEHVTQLQFKYPFVLQVTAGCELDSRESTKGFLRVAYQGSDFLSLQNMSWVPAPEGGRKAQRICDLIKRYDGIKETVGKLINNICPRFLWGLLDAGKLYLQRQVKPKAWLSSSPTLGSVQQLLICHVSGFYPKPIWVMWMRGDQELLGTHRDDVLPNADGTWYRRVILNVDTKEAEGLSCQVRHSSLEGQKIILYWGHHSSMSLTLLVVIILLMLPVVFALWFKKRCEMLPLSLLLLAAHFAAGDSEDAAQGQTIFRLIQISTFANSSFVQNQGSGWVDDLQIHDWDGDKGTATFLKPWSKGNFSDTEVTELEEIIRVYFIGVTREVQDRVSELHFEYPFEIQGSAGCGLRAGEPIVSFLKGAVGGQDLLSLQNNTFVPAPEGGSSAEQVCKLINQYQGICDIIRKLLLETCPRFLLGVLDAGKAELQSQEKPEAWLSKGSSPGPGRLQLVCHVSGFHPKAVWVMWMRGEQEERGTQRGDVLPHADGTWYLRATLDVASGEAAGLACRVRHSSLGGQDMVLLWGEKEGGFGVEMEEMELTFHLHWLGSLGDHGALLDSFRMSCIMVYEA
ncbi:T-cell surface glycoprotein CD1b, partial [Galemys pyrenaicus]